MHAQVWSVKTFQTVQVNTFLKLIPSISLGVPEKGSRVQVRITTPKRKERTSIAQGYRAGNVLQAPVEEMIHVICVFRCFLRTVNYPIGCRSVLRRKCKFYFFSPSPSFYYSSVPFSFSTTLSFTHSRLTLFLGVNPRDWGHSEACGYHSSPTRKCH